MKYIIQIKHFLQLGIVFLLFTASSAAFAHAFPVNNMPGAGASLEKAPTAVSIEFDGELEPVFSKLIVKDVNGMQVSQGQGQVEESNAKILTTKLNKIGPGQYHVYWNVVSRDGHRTQGDYTFTVE